MQAVRDLGQCVRCGSTENIQAAHRNQGKGTGLKVPDHLCACLCLTCHYSIDNGNKLSRAERRALMNEAIVLTFNMLVLRGVVRLG